MATKKVSYKNLLKQAISEFDTSKTVEVKGPMLDPILSWDGDGELPVYKDAASILERYYFNETRDEGKVEIDDLLESEYNEDGTEAKTDAEKHGEGTGTNQAGTSDATGIRGMEKDQEQEIAKEMNSIFEDKDEDEDEDKDDDKDDEEEEMEEALRLFFEQDEEGAEPDGDEGDEDKELDVDKGVKEKMEFDDEDVPEGKEYTDESEDIENAVIEKLIGEMEDLDELEMTYTGDGVKKGMEAPQEKKAKGPEEDTEGAGTEQAGTGTDAGQVPDRKDMHDQMVKPKNYANEDAGFPGGPEAEDDDANKDLEEAFAIFKEAIDDDEDEDNGAEEEPDGDED